MNTIDYDNPFNGLLPEQMRNDMVEAVIDDPNPICVGSFENCPLTALALRNCRVEMEEALQHWGEANTDIGREAINCTQKKYELPTFENITERFIRAFDDWASMLDYDSENPEYTTRIVTRLQIAQFSPESRSETTVLTDSGEQLFLRYLREALPLDTEYIDE